MKTAKNWTAVLALSVLTAAFAADTNCKDGVCELPAAKTEAKKEQAAPVPAPAPGAKAIQAAPKTIEEALSFLPDDVMTVAGKQIKKADVVEKIKTMIPPQFIGQIPLEQMKEMVKGLLDLEILTALAEKDGFKPSEELVRKMISEQLAKVTPEQKKELEARLKLANKTIDSFIGDLAKDKNAQREAAISGWVLDKIAPTVAVSDEDVLKYYNENKERFVAPESITASHILITPEKKGDEASEKKAEDKAKSILAQIRQGADFGTLAETESACPSGKRGKGALGKMTKDQLDQDFWKAAFALKKGDISDVVKTQFGYHIIKLEDKSEATAPKYEDLKKDISEFLKGDKINKKVLEAVQNAKTSGFAKIANF